MTAPDLDSVGWAMAYAIEDSGLSPGDVDYVNAHGTGTLLNDNTEIAALRRVFGNHQPAVSSTKSMFGHNLAAAGALEMIVTAQALKNGLIPPTMNYDEEDPDCVVDCVPGVARRADIDVAMSNSFAFGGLNAVLLARRYAA
jgi:nodulation protein E